MLFSLALILNIIQLLPHYLVFLFKKLQFLQVCLQSFDLFVEVEDLFFFFLELLQLFFDLVLILINLLPEVLFLDVVALNDHIFLFNDIPLLINYLLEVFDFITACCLLGKYGFILLIGE